VRHPEGTVHGFLALRTLDGETLGDGDLIQTVRGDQITSRLVFHLKDGSLQDETVVFTQNGVFRLVSDHVVQKGPSFEQPIETWLDAKGSFRARYQEKDGAVKVDEEHLDLPPDAANGLLLVLLKNVSPDAKETRVSMVAATPKPRIVTLVITPAGSTPLGVGESRRSAAHFTVKIDIGGIAGAVAGLLGKQPPDSQVWIVEEDAPAFVKAEAAMAIGGPLWRIELLSPTWPGAGSR
jgi:hypothetical protein